MPRSRSTTVTASPAAAAETAITTILGLTLPPGDVVDFDFTVDLTIGTAGVSVVLKLRRGTDATGTTVFTSSALTAVAGNHLALSLNTVDVQAAEQQNQAYTLTATVASASAPSTVNNVYLGAVY